MYPKMFSTDFIFRQQKNLVDNQKFQAGFRPLCNKILFLSVISNKFQVILSIHDLSKYVGIYIHTLKITCLRCFFFDIYEIFIYTIPTYFQSKHLQKPSKSTRLVHIKCCQICDGGGGPQVRQSVSYIRGDAKVSFFSQCSDQ